MLSQRATLKESETRTLTKAPNIVLFHIQSFVFVLHNSRFGLRVYLNLIQLAIIQMGKTVSKLEVCIMYTASEDKNTKPKI